MNICNQVQQQKIGINSYKIWFETFMDKRLNLTLKSSLNFRPLNFHVSLFLSRVQLTPFLHFGDPHFFYMPKDTISFQLLG